MAPPRYAKLSVPYPLWEAFRRLVEQHPEWGYRSPSDAATDAIREFVRRYSGPPEEAGGHPMLVEERRQAQQGARGATKSPGTDSKPAPRGRA